MNPCNHRNRISRILLFLSVSLYMQLGLTHSGMYEDYFEFDESDGGQSITVEESTLMKKEKAASREAIRCVDGAAKFFPCSKVDFLAQVRKEDLGGGDSLLNDIWGWTDPETGQEIAIIGKFNGTSFVDVTDGLNPVVIGFLPNHVPRVTSNWRDIKVYQDHAFIVSEARRRDNGLQVFDLRTLKFITPGSELEETAHLPGFNNAHNIFINEDSGYAYVVGSNQCGQGLFMVDISTPAEPEFAGCFGEDGYTHDVQCVIYNGPDAEHLGKEICVAYNEDTITIVDVTNKDLPVQLSRTSYFGVGYTHQGWFADDSHTTIIVNDEQDETSDQVKTTTYIFNVEDLDAPKFVDAYKAETNAIDHNLYVHNGLVYQSNYRAGLRILAIDDQEAGQLREVAYFDTIPFSDLARFSGTWSNYPFFSSGKIITSDIGGGLFILQPHEDLLSTDDGEQPQPSASPQEPPPVEAPEDPNVNVSTSTNSNEENQVKSLNLAGSMGIYTLLLMMVLLIVPFKLRRYTKIF